MLSDTGVSRMSAAHSVARTIRPQRRHEHVHSEHHPKHQHAQTQGWRFVWHESVLLFLHGAGRQVFLPLGKYSQFQLECWHTCASSFDELSRVDSYGTLGHVPPSTSNNFIFSSLWSSQLSKCCVVCEISWCRCQQLTALLISTALVTEL